MGIRYAKEPDDSLAEYPWFAFRDLGNGKRGYLAIADTEEELLQYIRKTYPGESVSPIASES